MSIENKNDASKLKKINDKPVSIADNLQKTPKDTNPSFLKTYGVYIGAGVGLVLVIFIVWLMLFAGSNTEPKAKAINQPTPEQIAEREAALAAEQAVVVPKLDPAIAALPADDFVFSTDPVTALAMQSTKDITRDLPEYNDTGVEIVAPDGRYLLKNDPIVTSAGMETYNMVEGYALENRLIELRAQNGVEGWFIRSGQGFEDADYVPIQTPEAAEQLRKNMRLYAAEQMRMKLQQAAWQTRQDPVALATNLPPAPVANAITLEERERLLGMIETQRSNNLELSRKNQELREEQIEVKNKVVDLVQRLEDSPKVGARLRATMIPAESGWKVSAVVGDRIYLINKDNMIVTLSQGDKIPDSNLVISHADENTHLVLVTPAN